MHGMPIEPVQIESSYNKSTAAGFLNPYKLLLLTYDGQKPPSPAFHTALAAWVRSGGALIVVDDDKDPYNQATDWWNSGDYTLRTLENSYFRYWALRRTRPDCTLLGEALYSMSRNVRLLLPTIALGPHSCSHCSTRPPGPFIYRSKKHTRLYFGAGRM